MLIPPIKSFKYELDFIIAYNEPMYINLVRILGEVELIENVINNIILINDWIISNEKILLNHDLLIKLKNAKGVISINILTNIYRKDCTKTKFNNSIEIKLFIIPSREKTLKLEFDILIVEFNFFTNSENEILILNSDSPISLIDKEM